MRRRLGCFFASTAALALAMLATRNVAAQAVEPSPDAPHVVDPATPSAPPRPWLNVEDATTPDAMHAVMIVRGTYASGGRSVTRPFAANLARPGAMAEIGGELGLLRTVSVEATGVTATGGGDRAGAGAGATAAVRFAPLAATNLPIKLSLALGWLLEPGGSHGAFARAAATYEVGRLRLGTNVHGERVIAVGRDAIDVLVSTGASVRVTGPLRAGVEYVAQDLEGYFDAEEAEGGVRHFVGPTIGLDQLGGRLSVVAGPGIGLSYATPSLVGRLAVAYAF